VLEEAEGEHRHQGVPVQPGPGPALEVVEAELLLELLVRPLARPARLDQGRQLLGRGLGRQVGEVVLPLTRGAVLADQPDLLARQVPAAAQLLALGRAHPQGGERGRERPLGPQPPADPAPGDVRQHGLGRDRLFARHRVLARPTRGRPRPRRLDRGRVEVLGLEDADRPGEAARAQPPAERGARPVPGIREHGPEAGAGGQHAVDLRQRQVGLGQRPPVLLGHAGPGAALRIGRPRLGQEQAQAYRHRDLTPGERERDQDLTVGALAEAAAVLAGHADRALALLRRGGVVDHRHRVRRADERVRLLDQEAARRSGASSQAGLATKCWSWSWPFSPSPAAIGCRLLRSPGPSSPRR
jgi:hypothetical protein